MKFLGVDWGEKRIGLAISDGSFAEPRGIAGSFEELADFIGKEKVEKVVLGLPEGRNEKKVRKFGRRIQEELKVPVIFRSEVLTSRQALERAIEAGKPRRARRDLDAASAAALLQEHLDLSAA